MVTWRTGLFPHAQPGRTGEHRRGLPGWTGEHRRGLPGRGGARGTCRRVTGPVRRLAGRRGCREGPRNAPVRHGLGPGDGDRQSRPDGAYRRGRPDRIGGRPLVEGLRSHRGVPRIRAPRQADARRLAGRWLAGRRRRARRGAGGRLDGRPDGLDEDQRHRGHRRDRSRRSDRRTRPAAIPANPLDGKPGGVQDSRPAGDVTPVGDELGVGETAHHPHAQRLRQRDAGQQAEDLRRRHLPGPVGRAGVAAAHVADHPLTRAGRELARETGRQPRPARAVMRPLACEDLHGDQVAQPFPRRSVHPAGESGRDSQHRGEVGDGQAVPGDQLKDLALLGRQAPGGVAGHDPQVGVAVPGEHRARVRRGRPRCGRRAAPYALPPSECVQPRHQPAGVGERVDMGLGRDQGVAERHLRAVGAAQHEPAVSVEALGMQVVERGEGTRFPRAEGFDQNAVIHVTDGKGLITNSSSDFRALTVAVSIRSST
ncbi:hypothetical protein CA984_35555 [Streptosporangium minutum]|uniref:Uncharacterized protein n=1 Tax=Streptosporangium minutum TaxID=569862 RepID=A0A243R8S6_9ACTN|nr:hypothetical protein CA984_35555 [Streptosporangium minutum]